ncbi:MAG: hypothetical protein EZS28_034479 [Streblomastix strix]|uniref:non-specific serine/threonine protein kinase n=1 Tax=Streblomastix strix TaxID=222440 RepID=A0A5J4UII4_9EUKA|nr:MAG: hypothetical protein EZS28_034479 [Streblomastix strix]
MFQKMDKHSDMFSLGIVVCEMLTGKHPFDGGSDQATIQKIIRNDVAKLPSFVPKEMQELVTSMINPNPASRPEIQEVLEQSTIKMYIRLQDGKRKAEEQVHQFEIRVHEQDEHIRLVEERAQLNEQQKIQAEEQVHQLELRVHEQDDHIRLAEERTRLAEQQKIQAEERTRLAEQQKIQSEERTRLAEQQQRESIEHNRVVEQWAQNAEEIARVAEGHLRTKETEIIRLQQENNLLRSSSVPIQSPKSKQQSLSQSLLPPMTQPKQIQIVQQTPIQCSRVQQSPNPLILKLNTPNGDKGRFQGKSFIHSNEYDYSTVTVDPIINHGVARFEVIFSGHEGKEFSLGIVESSKTFEEGYGPDGSMKFNNIKYYKFIL